MTLLGITTTTHFLDGRVDGLRTTECRVSPLKVHAAPWGELQALLATGLPATHGIYLLTAPTATGRLSVRPGEASDLRRRLLEHAADPTKAHFREVYAVSSVDNRLDKSDVRFLEARVHEVVAQQPGRLLEVDRIPTVAEAPAHERDTLESLFFQARYLLHASGCLAMDATHLPVVAEDLVEREEAVVEVRAESTAVLHDEHELTYDSCWSRGYAHPDGGFVLRAGSDIRRREGVALLPTVSGRRRLLAEKGVLGEIPGITDRWRLLSDVYCSSPLLAAKIATGAHLSRGIWQRLSPESRFVVAK